MRELSGRTTVVCGESALPHGQPFQHVYGGCRAQTLCGRNERQPKHVRSENEGHLATYWLLAQQFRC